jgi:GNAT superfamily N-acetyltransferase
VSPTIRTATASDAGALLELRALMFEAMGLPAAEIADPRWRIAAHGWFVDRIPASGVRVVVAEVDGRVVSGAVGEVTALIPGPGAPNGSVGLISNVATLPGYRGGGLASAVTDALLEWFRDETDVTRVDLFATPGGEAIYTPRGFARRDFPPMSLPVDRASRE